MQFLRTYKEIWRASQKEGGERNIFDFLVYRRVSTLLLLVIRGSSFSPNYITSLSVAFSLVATIFYFQGGQFSAMLIGVLAMNISLILDTLDGQYSRWTGLSSEFGGWYDGVSDSLKYIILFMGLSCGAFYSPYLEKQWFSNLLVVFARNPELILLLGMWIISNFFMIYYVHVSRYNLAINPGTVINVERSTDGGQRRFHFGIESTLYTGFTMFLSFNQTYWLFIVLSVSLPILWIYPFALVYRQYRRIDS